MSENIFAISISHASTTKLIVRQNLFPNKFVPLDKSGVNRFSTPMHSLAQAKIVLPLVYGT